MYGDYIYETIFMRVYVWVAIYESIFIRVVMRLYV